MRNKLFCTLIIIGIFFLFKFSLKAQNTHISTSIIEGNECQEDSFFIENTFEKDSSIEELITFCMPVKNFIGITSKFGQRSTKRWHYGVDIKVNYRDTIFNVWDGVVAYASYDHRGYGRYVTIKHFNGFTTIYAHLDSILVKSGDSLFYATPVGLGGKTGRATGVHLHFEIHYDKQPFNPNEMVDFVNGELQSSFIYSLQKKQLMDYLKQIAVKVYRVKKGDTISTIAQRHHIKVSTLYKLNKFLANTKYLAIGQLVRYQ
ncbi:MAG: peptidoglycan DD-metalloendopeptidase family protein [Chitinophagaceae bacterium]